MEILVKDFKSQFEYASRDDISKIIIDEKIEKIPASAFSRCTGLKEVVFQGKDTLLSKHAFSGCNNLVKVVLPENLKEIPEGCFMYCENLVDIKLPAKLEAICFKAFLGCLKLNTDFPPSLKTIQQMAFTNCGFEILKIENVKSIETFAFSGNRKLKKVFFLDDIELSSEIFSNCILLEEIHLPKDFTLAGFATCLTDKKGVYHYLQQLESEITPVSEKTLKGFVHKDDKYLVYRKTTMQLLAEGYSLTEINKYLLQDLV